MNKIKNSLLTVLLVMLLVGCNTTGTTSSNDNNISSISSNNVSSSANINNSSSSAISITTSATVALPEVTFDLVVTNLSKVNYFVGETIDITGLTVQIVTYTDGVESAKATLDSTKYILSIDNEVVDTNYVFTKSGEVKLVVTYVEDATLTKEITLNVESVITKRLEVNTDNMKITYEYGEEFDLTGLEVSLYTNVDGVEGIPAIVDEYKLKIDGVEYVDNYVFEVSEDQTISVEVSVEDSDIESATFEVFAKAKPAVDYIDHKGTYTVFDLSNNSDSTIVVTETNIIFGTSTLTYNISESGNFVVDSQYSNTYKLQVLNGVLFFTKTASSTTTKYVGLKGENVALENMYTNGTNQCLFNIKNDDISVAAMVYYSNLFAEGENLNFKFNNTGLSDSIGFSIRCLNDNSNDGILSLAYGYTAVYRTTEDNISYQYVYYSINQSNKTFTKVDVGPEKGTFKGFDGELVLDGLYGVATLEDVEGTYVYDKSLGVVEVTINGEVKKYKLNLVEFTYDEYVVINSDPWNVSTTYTAKNKFSLTFVNSTVTITSLDGSTWTKSTANYTVANGKVTFTLEVADDWGWTYDCAFELIINSDLSSVTLNKKVIAGDPNEWGTTEYKVGLVLNKA